MTQGRRFVPLLWKSRGGSVNSYRFTVVIEPDEDVFHAYVPALPGCHTFGATVDEARANIEEAMALHVESMLEDGEAVPVGILRAILRDADIGDAASIQTQSN
ncbi:MAG: type II toxin-antitoxin system HicB family antitoxin [Anaerolineae bacterium]|nr:type II toxin-antitoxin system HicB family antitoxin [Anaerolineae bacterium]